MSRRGRELETRVNDRGDVELAGLSIEEATPLIRDAVAASAKAHALTLLVGGNNAVTRPALLGIGGRHRERRADHARCAFRHARPRRGLEQRQSGASADRGRPAGRATSPRSASRASPTAASCTRMRSRPATWSSLLGDVRERGIAAAIDRALDHVAHCEALVIDCDIDVIDRSQFPGAPGGRPGGMAVERFLRGGAPAGRRPAGAADRPHRMGSAARSDRPQRLDRGALGRRVPRRLRAALAQPNSSLSSDGRSSGASWSNVHCFGSLSGRQRSSAVPWRKRPPVTWS